MSAEYEDYRSGVLRIDESAFVILGVLGAVLFFLLYLYWCAGECAKQNIRRLGVIILVRKRTESVETLCPSVEDPSDIETAPHIPPETQDVAPASQMLHSPETKR
ncbi:uncharacterized protein LOC110835778 [Zootermopsis nevadensis]|uniref:Uncharacterized protein n=1 Tax=Zootermopsis nevadensis TaxID=136037 RepID=A0A067QV53_ZOONE|nr:uncharacterized protein LOC110835778 [Zootermopsis nevadensis]KDR12937.1 hypothetical protein L798_12894 [Zootermopsis nevadensis]